MAYPGAVAGPPAQRGGVRIADRVYRRIAARAAADALAPAWQGRPEPGPYPRVSALLSHGRVRLTLHLELPFPADIGALARTAREAACSRITELTGTPVTAADVVVDRLHPAGAR
ncbi:hypothetical protein [Streptomyces sp. TLI_171]|uniref:hypothetical protein n=1 Tax=Streptomyces sp. TLI_171 TaxID=1938859 RepID=UPI000C174131|nr:hypothetical protein [Streptomyces sp. TLI_171]RKE21803.1 hypothetical protein BX266_5203 [Streptomyces sp. TLI_171]